MRRPQNTWRGFTERVVEPVVLAVSPLPFPSPEVQGYGARGLGSAVLFLCSVPRYSIWDVWERPSHAFWGQPVALFSLPST